MSQKKQLSILEFSRLTGINRDNLRFYDRIGLLKPEMRGENGYRYYTRRQLGSAYLIGCLRLLDVGVEDIRQYSAGRTPEKMLELFVRQEEWIQAELTRLRETSEIMKLYADMAQEALRHKDDEFLVEERKKERIFLCPPSPGFTSPEDGEILAYEYASSHNINLGYPMGIMFTHEAAPSGTDFPDCRYYFKSGRHGNDWKPAGLYAVAYGKGEVLDTPDLYLRLLGFIREQGLETSGNAYGEYLLDDLAVQEPGQHYGYIAVPVKARQG
jgi:DNA-binding transcriptional MerR regulator/effector-binding domain-containing protein